MSEYQEVARRIRGPLTPVLTAFTADGKVDIEATRGWIDWLIGQGHRLFWTTHGTSHYMCLSDQEVMDLTKELGAVCAGRATLIASAPRHWSTQQCRQFLAHSARTGVDAVKLQLDFEWQPDDNQVLTHYQAIAQDSPLPLLAYTRGRPGIGENLLQRIMEIPAFIGMKNDTDDYYGQERYLRVVRWQGRLDSFLVMTGGGLSSVLAGYEYGIRAYGDVTPWYDPARSRALYRALEAGRRDVVRRFIDEVEAPLRTTWATLAPGMHWSWGHAVLQELGHFPSRQMRFPLRTFNHQQAEGARAFLRRQQLIPPAGGSLQE